MKYFVTEPFSIETPRGIVSLPAGKVLELSQDQAARLGSKVRLTVGDNKHLPHYCTPGDCWCSAKFTGSNYPAECIKIGCGHYQTPGAERVV